MVNKRGVVVVSPNGEVYASDVFDYEYHYQVLYKCLKDCGLKIDYTEAYLDVMAQLESAGTVNNRLCDYFVKNNYAVLLCSSGLANVHLPSSLSEIQKDALIKEISDNYRESYYIDDKDLHFVYDALINEIESRVKIKSK